MKKVVGFLVTGALVFSVSAGIFLNSTFASKDVQNKSIGEIIHPKYVESLVEKREVAEIKAAYEAEIAELEESLKAVRDEIKDLRKVKPVDEEAIAEA